MRLIISVMNISVEIPVLLADGISVPVSGPEGFLSVGDGENPVTE
jgi:hypothetical protein